MKNFSTTTSSSGRALQLASVFVLLIVAGLVALWAFNRGNADNVLLPVTVAQSTVEEAEPVSGKQDPLRFVGLGDWGAGSPMQFDVARQMAAAWRENPYQAVILLGDNIYPDGNIKKHAEAYFNKPYKPLIDQGVQFYPVLGNHDVLLWFADDQIEFFGMPGRYYVQSIGAVDFFMLDTNSFSSEVAQKKWLSEALAQSQAAWKIVVGHHPAYTSGAHQGEKSIDRLRETLEPLMVRHGVDLYLAGHDHNYERFLPIQGVTHMISGGGGAYLRDFKTPLPQSAVRLKANHFVLFELDGKALTFEVIDKAGKIIDSGSIAPNHSRREVMQERPAA